MSTILCTVLPGGLLAQQPRPDSGRAGAAQDTLRRATLPAVQVTATAVPLAPGRVGFATTVQTRAQLEAELQPSLARVLGQTPGVSVEQGAGPGGPAVIHLRGAAEPFTQMMVDGVPINISGGFNDISGLLLTNVERVETSRGPLSALWGSSAAAGAIEVITRPGHAGAPSFDMLAEGGGGNGAAGGMGARDGQGRTEVAFSGGGDRLTFSAGGGLAYDRGAFDIANDMLTKDASLRLDWAPAARWTVTTTGRYMGVHSNLPVRDAGASRAPLDPNQKDSHERWLGSVATTWQATPTWSHRVTASLLVDEFYYMDGHDSLPGSYPFFVSNFNLSFNQRLVRPGLEYLGSNELLIGRDGASRLSLSYGGRWQHESELSVLAGDFGDSRTVLPRANAGVFTELSGSVGPRVSGVVGARVEKFSGLPSQLLPRLGLNVALVPQRLALRAAVGKAFKAPNVDQEFLDNPATVPNPNLRPEHSASWEVGATATTAGGGSSLGVTYFRQRYTDIIETVAYDSTRQTNRNLGSTRASGLELEADQQLAARLRWGGNLAFVRSVILDNSGLDSSAFPAGGTLPAVPRYTGTMYVSAEVSRAVSTLLRVTASGRQIVFSERFSGARVPTAAYATLDGVVQWRLDAGWSLYLRGENLLNARYVVGFDKPGVPRSVLLGVRTAG